MELFSAELQLHIDIRNMLSLASSFTYAAVRGAMQSANPADAKREFPTTQSQLRLSRSWLWLLRHDARLAAPYGSVRAVNRVDAPAHEANTIYCLPSCRNVIGTAVVTDGIGTDAASLPVVLSNA